MTSELTLVGVADEAGHPPPAPVGDLLRWVPAAVGMAVGMSFRGRSNPRGRRPDWLRAMSDVRLVEVEAGAETVVRMLAPRFGEAAGELYRQLELWPTKPAGDDTGFDLLGDIFQDLAQRRADSGRFDSPLLKTLGELRRVVNGRFAELRVVSRRYRAEPARLDRQGLATVREFVAATPPETQTRVVGKLDMIRASSNGFELKLDDGATVRGLVDDGEVVAYRHLLNERVLVDGRAVFRASGRLLRIDAAAVEPADAGPSIWSRAPRPRTARLDTSELRRPQGPRSGLAAIIGKWPGDETDDQVTAALRDLG